MKKFYLLLVMALGFTIEVNAQLADSGLPIVSKKNKKEHGRFFQKAGESLGEYCGHSLISAPSGTNSNTGIMFDVEASSDLFISGVSVDLYTGYSGKIVIYRRVGTHVGHESTPGDWIAVDSAVVTDAGGLTYIPIETGPSLGVGSIAAFYIRGEGASSDIDYANGTAIGSTIVSNSDLMIKTGTGINGTFGSNNLNRDFKGTLHYCKNLQVVCDTMQTQYNDDNSNKGIFFELETVGQSVTINQIFADFNSPKGTKQNVKVYTRPGSFVGFESSNIGWTLISDVDIISPLPDAPEAVSLGLSVPIPANSVQSFYLTSDGNGFSYSNGVNLGDTIVLDPVLMLKAGKGSDGNFSPSIYSPRIFNGTIDYCITSSVGEEELGMKTFTIYPNPVQNEIEIHFGDYNPSNVQIVDITGQIVLTSHAELSDGKISVDVSKLPTGTYFVKSANDSNFSVGKFVKL